MCCVLGCEPSHTIPADGADNDCDAVVDEEVRNYVDDDGDGLIDEDLRTWPIEITIPEDVKLRSCLESTEPSHTGRAVVLIVSDACEEAVIKYVDDIERTACRHIVRREWLGRDSCGNIVNATQIITVKDRTAPALSIPHDTVANCTELNDLMNMGSARGKDDCGGNVSTWYKDELDGCVVLRQWHGEDQCSNKAKVETQTIRLKVATPSFTVPSNVEISCLNDSDPSLTGRPQVSASALCGWNSSATVTVAMSDKQESELNCNQRIQRRWVVWDICGNVDSAIQSIAIRHDVALLDLPSDVRSSCRDSTDLDIVGFASIARSCRQTTVTPEDTLDGSVLLRKWMATDVCGRHTSPQIQTITLEEPLPVLTVPSNTSVLCHESVHPNVTGWAALQHEIDGRCIQLGGTATRIDYTDKKNGKDCPGFILRRWTATDFLGHTTHADQVIALGELCFFALFVSWLGCRLVVFVSFCTVFFIISCVL